MRVPDIQQDTLLQHRCGRVSIPPEKLLRAQLLMAFYIIRSERQLMEQINYNLLFRWFVGFSMDQAAKPVCCFSVDGTLIEALASLNSYRPKDED